MKYPRHIKDRRVLLQQRDRDLTEDDIAELQAMRDCQYETFQLEHKLNEHSKTEIVGGTLCSRS